MGVIRTQGEQTGTSRLDIRTRDDDITRAEAEHGGCVSERPPRVGKFDVFSQGCRFATVQK